MRFAADGPHVDPLAGPGEVALAALYEDTSPRVYGYLMARSGDTNVAGDVLSEVYVAAARSFAAGNAAQVTTPWLLTVAKRRLIDHWRRQSTRKRTVGALLSERDRVERPEAAVDRDQVLRALDSLGPKQRLALVLRYLDEMSVTEVSEELELSYQATESLLARARRSFKKAWEVS